MRIAVWHNLPSGGGKRALYDHVQGLISRGHTVESWCPPTADQTFLPMSDLVIEHIVDLVPPWRSRVQQIADLAVGPTSSTSITLARMDEHCRRCAAEIMDGDFDVVLGGSCWALCVTSLAQYLSIPKVLYLQEPFRPLYEALPELPWPALGPSGHPSLANLRRRGYDALRVHALRAQARAELDGIRAYDRVLANSYFSRESMLRAFGVDARVCYLGVDTNRYRDEGTSRRSMVVGIGSFTPAKRVEAVIEAVARAGAPGVELTWIGNVADKAYLDTLVELAKRRRVAFTPLVNLDHQGVVKVLNEASVMGYAPRLEPFGFAPLEAAACGLPVVALAEGGVRETVLHGETGLLVDTDEDLAVGIRRLLEDHELARSLGHAGRRRVEQFWSTSLATDRLEAHLLEVADRPKLVSSHGDTLSEANEVET